MVKCRHRERLLTLREAARIVRKSQGTQRRWRSQNRGPIVRLVGRSIRYPVSEVERWMSANS